MLGVLIMESIELQHKEQFDFIKQHNIKIGSNVTTKNKWGMKR